jgi:hypothetical protein
VWLIGSATGFGGLALGKFAKDKSGAACQQKSCRSGHLLVYLPDQSSGADIDPPLTVQ